MKFRPHYFAAVGFLATSAMLLSPSLSGAKESDSASPPKLDTSKPAPSPSFKGRIDLFTGTQDSLDQNWQALGSNGQPRWKVEDGVMTPRGGDIATKQKFKDFLLHVEFREPYMPDAHGQERGNSGVYLQGRYEIQVLDSYGIADPGTGDCGAVYSQAAPLVNANKPPLQWQTYDIAFRAPRMADGKVTEPARVTILLNGISIQNNQVINGVTGGAMDENVGEPGPIRLQNHGYPVAYRNIWVVPLPEKGATHY